MNIREISKPVTAKSLNESLAKKFGQKINIDAFTLEQLEDARNRIRTKLSQVETNESFDSVHTSEGYQKSKLFLDVLNAAISEHISLEEKKAKPDFLDVDKDGDKKEPMKKAAKDAGKGSKPKKGKVPPQFKKKTDEGKQVNELGVANRAAMTGLTQAYEGFMASNDRENADKVAQVMQATVGVDPRRKSNQTGNLPSMNLGDSVIREGAEDQAELVMASKDMVDRLTGWMEDTAEMQSESMLELADAIRDEMGSEQSEAFVGAVKPALEALYAAMETTRVALTQGVGMLTGEAAPVDDMGAPPADEMPMEPPVDDMDGELPPPPVDDFGAAEAAAGGDEEAGRAKRESKQYSKKKIAEDSKKLAILLSKKKS